MFIWTWTHITKYVIGIQTGTLSKRGIPPEDFHKSSWWYHPSWDEDAKTDYFLSNETVHPSQIYTPPLLPLRVKERKEKTLRGWGETERRQLLPVKIDLGKIGEDWQHLLDPRLWDHGFFWKGCWFFSGSTSKAQWDELSDVNIPYKTQRVHSSSVGALYCIKSLCEILCSPERSHLNANCFINQISW